MLVDLRGTNNLMKYGNFEQNLPVATTADPAENMARKKFFCDLVSSQAYQCLQMANEQSLQILSFIFGS